VPAPGQHIHCCIALSGIVARDQAKREIASPSVFNAYARAENAVKAIEWQSRRISACEIFPDQGWSLSMAEPNQIVKCILQLIRIQIDPFAAL